MCNCLGGADYFNKDLFKGTSFQPLCQQYRFRVPTQKADSCCQLRENYILSSSSVTWKLYLGPPSYSYCKRDIFWTASLSCSSLNNFSRGQCFETLPLGKIRYLGWGLNEYWNIELTPHPHPCEVFTWSSGAALRVATRTRCWLCGNLQSKLLARLLISQAPLRSGEYTSFPQTNHNKTFF